MRIWYQTMSDITRYAGYGEALQRQAEAILRPDTEIEVHGVAPGTYGELPPGEVLIYPLAHHLLLDQVIANAIQAEQSGCDVMAMGSYSEPHLRVIRSAVDIPVVSLAETTLLVGCSVARRIGLITNTLQVAWLVDHLIDHHHLRERTLPVRSVEPGLTEDDLASAANDANRVIEPFLAAARGVIAQGADVIIPAEGVLSQLLSDNEVREVDGVSVMDCVAVTMAYAEMMGSLGQATGLHAGRRWEYRKAGTDIARLLAGQAGRTP
jgi:allantoin racemase